MSSPDTTREYGENELPEDTKMSLRQIMSSERSFFRFITGGKFDGVVKINKHGRMFGARSEKYPI